MRNEVAGAAEERDGTTSGPQDPEAPNRCPNSSILVPFADQAREGHDGFTIPIAFADYVSLVEWTGRELATEKQGSITGPPPVMLQSLGMEPEQWLDSLRSGQLGRATALGQPGALSRLTEKLTQKWVRGKSLASRLWKPESSPAPQVLIA